MRERGQIFGIDIGGVKMFKMVPWAFGIYEFQLYCQTIEHYTGIVYTKCMHIFSDFSG